MSEKFFELTAFVDEDFANYKLPAMFLGTSKCDGKCYTEKGLPKETCQNCELMSIPTLHVPFDTLIKRYMGMHLTKAIVIGGLEPMLTWDETRDFMEEFRKVCDDPIVIYTGYYPNEVQDKLDYIKEHIPSVIVKFGRYDPDLKAKFDPILGVTLASENQFAEVIS